MPRKTHSFITKQALIGSCGITYLEEGTGAPLILLHGAPLASLGFMRVIEGLRGRFRVIAPDLPGFGSSSELGEFDGSLRSYSRFVVLFCEVMDLRGIYLYINDASGIFGLHAAAQMPDRISGIIVADTVALPVPSLVRFALKYIVNSKPVRFLNRKLNLLPWLVSTLAPLRNPFAPDERSMLKGQFDTDAKRDRILDVFNQMATDTRFVKEVVEQTRERIAQIDVLILFGQFDPMRWVGSVKCFRRLFPNHTLALVPFEEHFPILASGYKVAEVVYQWIKSQQTRDLGRAVLAGGRRVDKQ